MSLEASGAAGLDVSRWEAVEPRYSALAEAPLDEGWLARWSALTEQVSEGASRLSIRYSQDTGDPEREAAWFGYLREVAPRLQAADHALKKRWIGALDGGHEGASNGLGTVRRQFEADLRIHRDENLPLMAEVRARAARYGQLIGGLTVDFDGEEQTLAQLKRFQSRPERETREAAWRAEMDARESVRAELDELFDELLQNRVKIATNAGFDSYREFAWQRMGRFDYSPRDAEAFQAAIEEAVVPALRRQQARRAKDLGLEGLRPWDTVVDPHGREPLSPFESGVELAGTSERIFKQVDPELGSYVAQMRQADLLDLENRKGKAPGGYCATLSAQRLPFIFMNAVGSDDNVRTMLHEAGHAFHVFATRELPYVWQRRSPMEFAEVASMTMELLSAPYLEQDKGGFYDTQQALRSRIQHLERMITFLPYMATVDAFQHWLYAHPEHDHAERDGAWRALHERFCVGVDWSGEEEVRAGLWQHKLHIFSYPFYYIEYGIAQLGALQVWRNSRRDPAAALRSYREALALGGTRPLSELFAAAGAQLTFDAPTIAELVAMVDEQVQELRDQLADAA